MRVSVPTDHSMTKSHDRFQEVANLFHILEAMEGESIPCDP